MSYTADKVIEKVANDFIEALKAAGSDVSQHKDLLKEKIRHLMDSCYLAAQLTNLQMITGTLEMRDILIEDLKNKLKELKAMDPEDKKDGK